MSLFECRKQLLLDDYIVHIIQISGRITPKEEHNLYCAIVEFMNEGHIFFLLDFANVQYLDSARLSFLLILKKNGAVIKLTNLSKDMLFVFKILRFTHIFAIYETQEQAISSFVNSLSHKEFREHLETQKPHKVDLATFKQRQKQQQRLTALWSILVMILILAIIILTQYK